MIPALLAAVAVLALGSRLQPRAVARRPDGERRARLGPRPQRRRFDTARFLRRTSAIDPAELAVWCDSLARALRGGATLHGALRAVDPPASVAGPLAPVLLALERGASVGAALADLTACSPHLDLVVVVLRACAEHGGAAAEPIDRAATALRQRAALAAERRTNSAQARMSAVVMTLLPGAMLIVLLTTSGAVRASVAAPLGFSVVLSGALLNLVGWLWMRRLVGGTAR